MSVTSFAISASAGTVSPRLIACQDSGFNTASFLMAHVARPLAIFGATVSLGFLKHPGPLSWVKWGLPLVTTGVGAVMTGVAPLLSDHPEQYPLGKVNQCGYSPVVEIVADLALATFTGYLVVKGGIDLVESEIDLTKRRERILDERLGDDV